MSTGSNVYDVSAEMHNIRAKLYPNHLAGGEGTYIARNANEKTLTVENICAAMKTRGGYDGSYEDAVQTVKHFLKETIYQLCDGFTINLGFFTIHINVGGVFEKTDEPFNRKKHPLTVRFGVLKALQELINAVQVTIDGHITDPAWIDDFIDTEEGFVNSFFVVNNMFVLTGHKIKIEGEGPKIGMFVVPVNAPEKAVQVARISENTASKITGIMPASGYEENYIEIRTQYSGSNIPLKTIRTIKGPHLKQV